MLSHTQLRLVCLALICYLSAVTVAGINVLSQRVEVPKPDGSGVVFIQLQADPADPNIGDLTGFNVTALTFITDGTQVLRLWNSAGSDCNGAVVTVNSLVPADGKVCFFSNTTVAAEFQNSFSFKATASPSSAGNTGTVTLLNYNRQLCTGIPDLGPSASFKVPPTPTATIALSGLQIKFDVDATYIRNQTTWFLDFFDFDSSAGGDSADGTGRTCSNHMPANYPASFSDWWYSAPRATYNSGVHSTIDNALNNTVYPNYKTTGGEWTISAVDCSTVHFTATIPVSALVRNLTTDCHRTGYAQPAASRSTGPDGSLVYSATLYAMALRPVDRSDSTAGYYMSTFAFPFTFSLQTTISNLQTTSTKWDFSVDVLSSVVTYSGSPAYTLDLQTTISAPGLNSPNVLSSGFALPTYPHETEHTNSNILPTLTRVGTNGNCGTSTTAPCIIQWRMVLPQLSLADLGNSQSAFDTQYAGQYSFQWTTTDGDVLVADLYADVSAVDPSTNLTTVPVTSSLGFYTSLASLQNTGATPLATPTFSSGEKIYVRHSFLVDSADIKAFVFTLKQAWVCHSSVPGFAPSLANGGTGCSADIPGVMEAANGERVALYDRSTLPNGIADVVAAQAGEQSYIWDWTIVPPTDSQWTGGSTVNNGFSINAQPLAVDNQIHTYYFHLVSTVTQAALGRRSNDEDGEEVVVHTIVEVGDDGRIKRTVVPSVSAGLQSVQIQQGSNSNSGAMALRSPLASIISAASELLKNLL